MSKQFASRLLPLLGSLPLFALTPAAAHASDDPPAMDKTPAEVPPQQNGDIVVTAERRETSLLKTPGAITPISGDDLRSRRVESLEDLSTRVPGLSSTGGAPQASLYIRGIGTSDPGSPPSVGIYVDDVYNPRAFGNNLFDLPDVQAVEVLRGPQGTLYGLNTSGGAIKIISRKPSDTFQGSVLAEVGNYDAFRSQIYLTGPIIADTLSASIAYTGRKRNGYVHNQTLNYDVEDADSNEARVKLRFTPTDRIEAILAYTILRDASDTQSVVPLNYGNAGPRVTYSPHRFDPSRDVDTISGHVTFKLDDQLSIKSITAYRTLDNLNPNDASGLPYDQSGFIQLLKDRQTSEELQLLGDYGRLNFVLGAVYRHETFSMDRNAWQALAYSEIVSNQTVVDEAIYGQANYNLTHKLRLTLGGRVGWQQNSSGNTYYRTDATFARTKTVYSVGDLHYNDSDFSPKIGIDWQLSPRLLAYASWTRGAKSGGFNRSASTAQIATIPVRPETVTTYEAGLKGKTSDNLLSGSAAIYYNKFSDYQASITNPVIDGQLIVGQVVANAAQATTYGGEVEATLQPQKQLLIHVSAAYLDAKFDNFENPTGAAATNYKGKWIPFASKWIVTFDVNFDLPIAIPGKISLRGALNYKSPTFSDNANRPQVQIPAQLFADLSATYTSKNQHWVFQAQARNLFNATTIVGYRTYTPAIGISAAKYAPPRLVTVSAKYNF